MADQVQQHNVSILVNGKVIEKWTNYGIEQDMLKPADSFHMEITNPTKEMYALCKKDSAVDVFLDGNVVMTGFIDERHLDKGEESGTALYIAGRDKGGRLVDESAPVKSYKGLDVKKLMERLVQPWFPEVTFSNDINRTQLLGLNTRLKAALAKHSSSKGHRARPRHSSTKAVYPNLDFDGETRVSRKKVMPGEKRWQVIRSFLEELGLMGWSSADGKQFIVGQPDYTQDVNFNFIMPAQGERRGSAGAILSSSLRDGVTDRYSRIVALGMGAGDFNVNCSAQVVNGPGKDGIGKDFQFRKNLYVVDDKIRTKDEALVRAKREMAERDATGNHLQLHVRGHAQDALTYAMDAMASYHDNEMDIHANYLITSAVFEHSGEAGETTMLHLVPQGTVLRI